MVRFNRDELLMLMGALESFWGDYENWEQESDEETKNEYKKYHEDAVRIYKKIDKERDARDERKILKMAKELQEKQKNNN